VTNGGGSGMKFFKIILFQHGTTALLTQSPSLGRPLFGCIGLHNYSPYMYVCQSMYVTIIRPRRSTVDSGVTKEACVTCGAHSRHLTNTM